jgi:hypothetical protein
LLPPCHVLPELVLCNDAFEVHLTQRELCLSGSHDPRIQVRSH